ncbi:hypothetical protein EVAR_14090_1 [Eumeta japonica]|uniref:Uncharacterized protein n=1 Tax=Eumeta variegata TaxID=151549 RepID=A0A4C1UN84_EUMVA|nr:hypothetical protein EVAR_14090_1 [Eumeta japonica]
MVYVPRRVIEYTEFGREITNSAVVFGAVSESFGSCLPLHHFNSLFITTLPHPSHHFPLNQPIPPPTDIFFPSKGPATHWTKKQVVTRNSREATSVLPAFWEEIRYLMEERSGPLELSLTGRTATAETAISSVKPFHFTALRCRVHPGTRAVAPVEVRVWPSARPPLSVVAHLIRSKTMFGRTPSVNVSGGGVGVTTARADWGRESAGLLNMCARCNFD